MKIRGKVIINGVEHKNQVVDQGLRHMIQMLLQLKGVGCANFFMFNENPQNPNVLRRDYEVSTLVSKCAKGTCLFKTDPQFQMTVSTEGDRSIVALQVDVTIPQECGNYDINGNPAESVLLYGAALVIAGNPSCNLQAQGYYEELVSVNKLFAWCGFDAPVKKSSDSPLTVRWVIEFDNSGDLV